MKAYLASHFFDLFGREGTAKLAKQIREAFPGIDLYVPQENGEINDKESNDENITAIGIYEADRDKLLNSDVLIAYIDGVEIDSGVAGEILSMATQLEMLYTMEDAGVLAVRVPKVIIGLYTDCRQKGTGDNHMYKNLFVKGAIERWGVVVETPEEMIKALEKYKVAYDRALMSLEQAE